MLSLSSPIYTSCIHVADVAHEMHVRENFAFAYVINFAAIFRETQQDPLLLDVRDFNSLRNSKFNKNHPTKIIIHGFGGGRNLVPSTHLRDGKNLLFNCAI